MSLFHTILLAADHSEPSLEAFRLACALAGGMNARIIVLHVVEPEWVAEEPTSLGPTSARFSSIPRGPDVLEVLKSKLRELYHTDRPIRVEYQIREGAVAEEVLRAVDETCADLIVMGTQGRTGVTRLFAGSVAEAVLRWSSCPVLALRKASRAPRLQNPVILHPTDFSESSDGALDVARTLARDLGAKLVVLHVEPLELRDRATAAIALEPRLDGELLKEIGRRVEGPDLKFPVEVRMERGNASTEIVRLADAMSSSMIVMGSHGRTGLRRLLLGSVAEGVLRKAQCPVLVAKAPVGQAVTLEDSFHPAEIES